MSQKFLVNSFEQVKDISRINKRLKRFIKLIKNYDEYSDKGFIFGLDIDYLFV